MIDILLRNNRKLFTFKRRIIEQEFCRQNIPFSFFDAVTPDHIEDVAKKFNITLDRSTNAKLFDGEIGCALSHIALWELVVENDLDYINIFEDDIHLGENAKELLEVDYLSDDNNIKFIKDLINIGMNPQYEINAVNTDNIFSGKTVVLTGKLVELTRNEAKEFLVKKAETITTVDKATLESKKNYIALFYGLNTSDISVDNNTLVFNYNGSAKRLSLNDITVPAMSSDLEGDFEKEITALASSMNTTVEHIQVQDGQMIVNHGDHNHYYPIKSPGWRTYNQNKIPYIDIPKVSGNIDEAVVNSRLTELENKAQTVLANNPAKLRKVLSWLNNFRDVSLAWHVTGTEGYLQALDKFEKTQIDI